MESHLGGLKKIIENVHQMRLIHLSLSLPERETGVKLSISVIG